jgi:uncharacterized protein (DUF1810 family)
MPAADPHGLQRFVDAQRDVYAQALAELRRGRKTSHWMWFVFPQLAGLGRSETARFYGIASRAEAAAYLAHPLLGPRLRECTQQLLGHHGASALQIFGPVDALKFGSSMTLFEQVAPDEPLFARALDRYQAGRRDPLTLALLDPVEPTDHDAERP